MHDLVIRRGMVIDGLGNDRRLADVGISDGLITEMAKPGTAEGAAFIDADGLVVAPGFIDIHTHYDAQLTWDPAPPSVLHGVTTVIGGNCGFSLAPISAESAGYLVPMLATVEGMSEAALSTALDVSWRSFEEFLAALDGAIAINAGFMVGHSALRRLAMGEAAVGGIATAAEVEHMARLLHESISAGAVGFSTSRGQAHVDHNGDPVPSRHARTDEVLALCHAAGEHPGTSIEAIPTIEQTFGHEAQLLLTAMSLAAGRPVNWNLLTLEQDHAARSSRLEASDIARSAGGKVVALAQCEPVFTRYSLEWPFLWESIPGWAETMRLPSEQRLAAFADTAVRDRLRDGAMRSDRRWVRWADYRVNDAEDPALQAVVGRRVGDIATERGQDAFTAFCDLAVAGHLRVGWRAPMIGTDDSGWASLVELLRDPRVAVGGSDAGAHLDIISAFAMHTAFLAEAVRERNLLSLEEAIAMFTSAPAELYGLRDRGRLAVGARADIVIFDAVTVGQGPMELRDDLPAKARRIFIPSRGVAHVLVNGVRTVREGELTGATAGQTIRSGQGTRTPQLQ